MILDAFTQHFGPRAASPRQYLETDWSAEEWTRGCYGAHFPPGAWTEYGPALRSPVRRIHWAGTETSSVWNGYLEGAVRSGERVAGEVLTAGPDFSFSGVVPSTVRRSGSLCSLHFRCVSVRTDHIADPNGHHENISATGARVSPGGDKAPSQRIRRFTENFGARLSEVTTRGC